MKQTDRDECKQSEAPAVVANDELVSCFKLKVDPGHCDTIDSPVKDMHDTDEDKNSEYTESLSKADPNQETFNIFEELSNVKIDNAKCRRGRPKRTKKLFWNFSSAKSKASGKKRKASDDLQNQQKHFKSEDNACNKNS